MKKSLLIFLFVIALTGGVFFIRQTVFAMTYFGGRVMSVVYHPIAPGDPCSAYAPWAIMIGPPRPSSLVSPLCGVTWPSRGPVPPRIGSWVLGWGTPMMILRGGTSR